MSSQTWFEIAAGIFIAAGVIHAGATLVDLRRPTCFAPRDMAVRALMDGTGVRFRQLFPGGDQERPSVWRAWLGFNLSHGLGAAVFGLVCLMVAGEDYGTVRDGALLPVALAVSALYSVLAVGFWFWLPTAAFAVATACFALACMTG